MCVQSQVPTATDQMAERLLSIANGGALSLMISLGHRTGLFDTMAQLPASTSVQIADAASLNERYVREWLGAMVTGGLVEYDSETKTYALPDEAAALLTRAATPNNMSGFMQWIGVLGAVEDRVLECFRNGGGLGYHEYRRFHDVMAEESNQTTVSALGEAILPLIPQMHERLQSGIRVLDVGCGSGRALIMMAALYPKSSFFGYDLCDDAVASACAEAQRCGVKNVHFERRDVSTLGEQKKFGLITAFDAVHDQAKPDVVLKNIFNALEDDGVFLMQDIRTSSHVHKDVDNPLAPFIYTISCMHCMSVSLGQGGMGLGAAWGEEKAAEMLKDAGFLGVQLHQLPHDILNTYYVARKHS